MLWLLLYCVLSVVIARWLEKHMKIAAVFHSILFIFLMTYLLFLCDIPFITNAMKNILGDVYYSSFRESLFAKYRVYSVEISVFIILEMLLLFLSIVVLAVTAVKVAKEVYNEAKKQLAIFKERKVTYEYFTGTRHFAKKIYLHFCKLLN